MNFSWYDFKCYGKMMGTVQRWHPNSTNACPAFSVKGSWQGLSWVLRSSPSWTEDWLSYSLPTSKVVCPYDMVLDIAWPGWGLLLLERRTEGHHRMSNALSVSHRNRWHLGKEGPLLQWRDMEKSLGWCVTNRMPKWETILLWLWSWRCSLVV